VRHTEVTMSKISRTLLCVVSCIFIVNYLGSSKCFNLCRVRYGWIGARKNSDITESLCHQLLLAECISSLPVISRFIAELLFIHKCTSRICPTSLFLWGDLSSKLLPQSSAFFSNNGITARQYLPGCDCIYNTNMAVCMWFQSELSFEDCCLQNVLIEINAWVYSVFWLTVCVPLNERKTRD